MPRFTPLPLRRLREPFDHPDWIYEVKYDGFRALAHVRRDGADLVSRNGHRFGQFTALAAELRTSLRVRSALLDGEVVCLDREGRSDFNALLFRRGMPAFVAFDVLALNDRDVRALPLVRRKVLLRGVVPPDAAGAIYAEHVDGTGCALFALVCEHDLEGIVAKSKRGTYAEPSSWIKKNPAYTGARDRHELLG